MKGGARTEGGGGGGSRGCESERQRFFTWEKNVDEMNGKGTCPRLLVKKHKIRPDAYEGCRDAGGKSAGVMSTIAIRSQMSDFSTSTDSSEAERGSGM